MKIKLLGLSLISVIALAGCGNSNNYNVNLPKGGETVNLKEEKNRKDLIENINSGISSMTGAFLSKGISLKADMELDGEYIDYHNDEERDHLTISDLKATANLDAKGNLTKLTASKGIEILKGLEMVTSFKVSGNGVYSDMVKVKTDSQSSSSQPKRQKVSTDIKLDKLGAKAELTDGTFYLDFSDGSFLKNGLANYDSVAKLTSGMEGFKLPTKEEFSKLLPLKEGQTFDQYVTDEWKKEGYNKLSISIDEIAALTKEEDEEEENLTPVVAARKNEESSKSLDIAGKLEEAMALLSSVDGVLEYKTYKNKTSGLKVTLNKEQFITFSVMSEYYDNFKTLEGFKMDNELLADYEGMENFEFSATAMMDENYCFTSITAVLNVKNTNYDKYLDEETKVTKVEKEMFVEINGKVKVTASYDGMKNVPAKEHKDYVPAMKIVGGLMELLAPSSEQVK